MKKNVMAVGIIGMSTLVMGCQDGSPKEAEKQIVTINQSLDKNTAEIIDLKSKIEDLSNELKVKNIEKSINNSLVITEDEAAELSAKTDELVAKIGEDVSTELETIPEWVSNKVLKKLAENDDYLLLSGMDKKSVNILYVGEGDVNNEKRELVNKLKLDISEELANKELVEGVLYSNKDSIEKEGAGDLIGLYVSVDGDLSLSVTKYEDDESVAFEGDVVSSIPKWATDLGLYIPDKLVLNKSKSRSFEKDKVGIQGLSLAFSGEYVASKEAADKLVADLNLFKNPNSLDENKKNRHYVNYGEKSEVEFNINVDLFEDGALFLSVFNAADQKKITDGE